MILDFQKLDGIKRYKVMSQTVVPRPIAWIVTKSQGIINIAPFSYFTPLSSDPATVVVSIGHKQDGTQKDTLSNILQEKKATICFVKEEYKDLMDATGEALLKTQSEADYFNIPTKEILQEYPPIVQGVQCAFFCNYLQTVELEGKTVPIILEIKSAFYEDDSITQDLKISTKNIGRVGRKYGKIETI